jgi:uncharacterized protein (DUF1800 family)
MSLNPVFGDLVSRAGIRAGAPELEIIALEGWNGWVRTQLALGAEDGATVRDALKTAKLKIEYDTEDGIKGLKEDRHLSSLKKPIAELWHLADWEKKMAWEERIRPSKELVTATIIRATLSPAQLRETVTDFWRDHFSVNSEADEAVAIALPSYDQDVLRVHAFGNFRELLEAVAQSTAMLAYLNNASSRASPANENYARELLELHTLGAGVYLNAQYDKWRDVPGALVGAPQGYIDQDVYEAARAFTGWTYANGQEIAEGVKLPVTGEFNYAEAWHDPYQKRILATEFDAHLAPMADGRKALDLVAFHPATAANIASKLCTRFVSDTPSAELIKTVADVFSANAKAHDQIGRTIEAILLSAEFASATPRLQRPLFLFASMQRSAGILLSPDPEHFNGLSKMGQRLYTWHTPAGHPLRSGYWQSPGLIVQRWRTMMDIWKSVMAQTPPLEWDSVDAFAQHWGKALGVEDKTIARAASLMRKEYGEDMRRVSFREDDRWVTAQTLSFLSASTDYQTV